MTEKLKLYLSRNAKIKSYQKTAQNSGLIPSHSDFLNCAFSQITSNLNMRLLIPWDTKLF